MIIFQVTFNPPQDAQIVTALQRIKHEDGNYSTCAVVMDKYGGGMALWWRVEYRKEKKSSHGRPKDHHIHNGQIA